MEKKQEVDLKRLLLLNMLEKKSKTALFITEQPNFSWLTGGCRGFLGLASTKACASLLVTKEKLYLLANNIEGARLMEEEQLASFCELVQTPWQQDGGMQTHAVSKMGLDPVWDTEVSAEISALRQTLVQQEQDRYRTLCRDAARALENTMKTFTAGISEFEAAGRISAALWGEGVEPISLFIAADDRIGKYRHFIPTEKRAMRQLTASICGRKHGLVVSITRTVSFASDADELKSRYRKLLKVESAAWNSLHPGRQMADIYHQMCRAYSENGMDQEWMNHHQGGLTGYLPREIRIDASTDSLIQHHQAYAFNPSCAYAKTEDTVLLTSAGVEVLSRTEDGWPMVPADGYLHPDILTINP